MALVRWFGAVLWAAPLLALAQDAAPPAGAKDPAREGVRASIRELERTIQAMRMGGVISRRVPCMTDQVNSLLEAPREVLRDVLAERLRPVEGDEDRSSGQVPRIAAFLAGIGQTAERRFEGPYLLEMHGFALLDYAGDGFGSSKGPQPPPPPEVVIGPDTRFRSKLRPRPFDLLKGILVGDGEVRAMGDRMMGDCFRSSAGLELGEAARRDPEFGKFLLAVCAEPHDGETQSAVLAGALGRWAGPDAVQELKSRLQRALRADDEDEWHRSVTAVASALTTAGADAALAALVRENADGLPADRKDHARRLLGGDAGIEELLERAEKEPTVDNLGALASALNDADTPTASVKLRIRCFDAALRIRRESKDDRVRGWARAVAQNSLWAGLYWRFGYMQGKNFPEDADREAPLPWGAKCENERDHFLGAWPDIEEQGAALKQDFEAGRIREDERWRGWVAGESESGDIDFHGGRVQEKDPGIALAGRREGEAVVLAITNRRSAPVAVNTLVPRYSVAIMVPLKGEPKGRMELDLQAGRVLSAYGLLAKPEVYRRIAPGETIEMRFRTGKLPEGSRVLLSLRDEMRPDGDLGVPRIRNIWDIPVR